MPRLCIALLVGFGICCPVAAQTAVERRQTISWVKKLQGADGGFMAAPAKDGGTPAAGSLRATAAALRIFKYFGGDGFDREACKAFVESCFDKNSGGFADRPGDKPAVALTAVGLMALVELQVPNKAYRGLAVRYMEENAREFEEIRMAAAGLEAIGQRSAKTADWLEQIAKMRNEDGTYGKGPGIARASGGAVAAVLRLRGSVEQRGNVLRALMAGQRPDGGFGKEDAKGSDLETTYRVMRSFAMLKAKPDVDRCRTFVARCRNADGGYGISPGQPSQTGPTYFAAIILHWLDRGSKAGLTGARRTYRNELTPIRNSRPLLADYPEFVQPVQETTRLESPALVQDPGADLHVRAWRFSYNARGIIEVPNSLRADQTAVIVVHPWGIDDGQGWTTPEPNGVAFGCTPDKNELCLKHMAQVVNPFLKSLRGKVKLVAYSLPGSEDPIRKKIYRSIRSQPTAELRRQGQKELAARLKSFRYQGEPLPDQLTVSTDKPVIDYFRQFPGLDAGARFNNAGFWDLPIPVAKPIEVDLKDVVIYDPEGYAPLKEFLQKQGVRHVLLAGYHADMCVCRTTAGYLNLSKDFNLFLVGDAVLATFPANATTRYATNATVSFAALDQFITQVSWVRYSDEVQTRK